MLVGMAPKTNRTPDHVDVLIIGAGLSGIGAAAHLRMRLPGLSFAILERRAAMGGTWDLFRYPGVRSDSDMHTLGYRFRPWASDDVLADGASIKQYVEETAAEYDLAAEVRYGHHVKAAAFDSASSTWTVTFEEEGAAGGVGTMTAGFLWACSGYYDYDRPYSPELPGLEDFTGHVVHPQFWPEDLDYAGKRVVVIGSGATAVTLVPAMAAEAEKVTMLQRSPTYILSIPSRDPLGGLMRKVLPAKLAGAGARWRNVLLQAGLYQASRRLPKQVRAMIRKSTAAQLPQGYDIDTHFKPAYDPWDQRMCIVPDGDLFKAIRKGKAEIVTGHIASFAGSSIVLTDGTEIEADIVVTATGLAMQMLGGIELSVDGQPTQAKDRLVYKGCMLDGVPNFAFVIGYTNASWTLKADLVSEFVVRLLKERRAHDAARVVPVRPADINVVPLMPLDAGYIKRAAGILPQAGDKRPWQMPNNYLLDIARLRRGKVDDGVLEFS